MKWDNISRQPLAKACAVALIAGAGVAYLPSALAATAAGTQIKNLATVTYEDAAGNPYSAQSNEAVVTVSQVYSASIGVDNAVSAAAGQIVYLPHVLTNTGNGADTYTLTATNDGTITDSLDSSSVEIYHDLNQNGVPDSGEPIVSSLTLDANDPTTNGIANLVVAVQVPTTATENQTLGVVLTAAASVGTVDDLTGANGTDGAEGTNQSLITVTGDAVLVVTKSAVHDAALEQITYTVNVKNNGNSAATDVVIFDGLPEGTTLVSSSVSGLLATNGDTLMADPNTAEALTETGLGVDLNANTVLTDDAEATLGIDLNSDGDQTDTGITGVYAVDADLPASATVSLSFTVSYDPATLPTLNVTNVGHVSGDTDPSPTDVLVLVSSNPVVTIIGNTYAVEISDTGAGANNGVNDGGDDDTAIDGVQSVDLVSTGSVVLFDSIVTNNGNADDFFNLTVSGSTFPAGTAFTFFDATGNVPLGDTDGSGIDTGIIAGSGATKAFVVKATLPPGFSGTGPFVATVTATSGGDPSATPVSDTSNISLGAVIEAVADLHNGGGTIGVDDDALGAPEYAAANTYAGQLGNTVNIPLYIDNDTAASDSFVLSAGSSWNAGTNTLGPLAAGWSVEFYVGSGGVPSGPAIFNSGAIPPATANFEIIAVVTIPNDGSLASTDVAYDNDDDGTDETLDGPGGDGDGDYPIFFRITSPNTSATDIKLDAIDVDSNRAVSLVVPGINQVEAGGSVSYSHTLTNAGNVDESVELVATNSQGTWTNTLSIDTDGDGVADTIIANLLPGSTISVLQTTGVIALVQVTDTDTDTIPELVLESGMSLPIEAVVFAPSNGAPNETDILTIDATNVDGTPGAPSAQVTDQTNIISGQVRLLKTVAVDSLCSGTPDGAFEEVQLAGVEPGQCVIWQVVATNQGSTTANNVIIYDAVTAFSDYEVGSLSYCLSLNCAPDPTITDGLGDDEGEIAGSVITFYVGNNSDPSTGTGGELVAGEQATVRFSVKVQ